MKPTLAVLLFLQVSALAQSPYTWDPAAGNEGSWGADANWSGSGIPDAGDSANFETTGSPATITLDGDRNIKSLGFSNANASWTLNEGVTGSTLNFTDGDSTAGENSSVVTVTDTTVNLNVALGKTIADSNANASDAIIFKGSGGTVNLAGILSGPRTNPNYLHLGSNSTAGTTGMIYNIDTANCLKNRLYAGFSDKAANSPVNPFTGTTVNINASQSFNENIENGVAGGSNAANAGVMVIRNGGTWEQSGNKLVVGFSGSNGQFNRTHGRVEIGVTGDSTGFLLIGSGGGLTIGHRGGTGILNINNGTVTINANSDTTTTILGGASANNDASGGGNGTINLNTGGTLITARQFATQEAQNGTSEIAHGTGTFNFNGGLLRINRATGLVTTDLFEDNITVNVLDGGARIDTQTHNTTIDEALIGTGTGGLEKLGAGTLTLGGTNTYLGATRVTEGTLAVNGSSLLDTTDLVIENGANTHLTNTETVHALFFGTVPQVKGTWGASGSGAAHIDDSRFSGPGMLLVQEFGDPDVPIFDETQAQQIAGNLFPAIDLDAPGLASVKTLYQEGSHTEALSAYMNYFLQRLALEGAGLPVDPLSDVDALYRTSVTSPPTTDANAARDEVDAILTAMQTAAVTNLERAMNDANPLEFGAAIARIAAIPWAGGTPLMEILANSQPKTAADPYGGYVANQIFWYSINHVAKWLPSFDHFKKVTEPYPDPLNSLGLGEWRFKMEFQARNLGGALSPVTESAFIHPDGSGLEQSPGYHRHLLAHYLEQFHPFEDNPWFDGIRENEMTRASRFLINISKLQRSASNGKDGGRFGLGSEPPSLFTSPGTGNIATIYAADIGDYFGTDLQTAVATGDATLAPTYSSVTFPFGGYTVFRNRWTRDALQIFFHNRDNAPPGGHSDFSTNQFSLDAYGRTLLTDLSGDRGPTQAHNTIAIDGLSQSPNRDHSFERNKLLSSSPTPNRWLHGNQIDFAEGRYDGGWRAVHWDGGWQQTDGGTRPEVSHHRQMVHLRPFGAMVVLDRIIAPAAENHHYSQSWNFPTLFGENNVNLDAANQRIFTSDPAGANIFIRHFGPTLSYAKYYGDRNADTTLGPAWRGNRVPDGNFYNPDPAVWLPYSEVAATWTGSGPQLVVSLANPGPGLIESVATATELSGPGYSGFEATLDAKTDFSAGELAALGATHGTANLAAWNLQATAENLILSSTDGRLHITGVVTGATRLTFNSSNLLTQVPLRDFEFTLRASDGTITAWKAIQTPADFKWTGGTLPTTLPDYGNENPALWSATTGGSWHDSSRWHGAAISNSPGARARLGLSTSSPVAAVALGEPLTIGSLAFDHPSTRYTVGTSGGPGLALDNGSLTTRASLLNGGGEHRIEAPLHLASAEVQLFSARATDSLTLAGPITSASHVTLHKNGRGLVHLAGNNTFTGEIRIAKGLLRIDSDEALGDASNKIWLVVSDSVERERSGLRFGGDFTSTRDIAAPGIGDFSCIDVLPGNTVTLAGAITHGGLTKTGVGTLILSGQNHSGNGRSGIAGGRLVLDYTTQNNSKLPNSGITFGGGIIELRGGSHLESTNEIYVTYVPMFLRPGHTEVTRSSGSSILITAKRFQDVNRSPGATVDARQSGILRMVRGTAAALYGGWATVAGSDFAVSSSQYSDGAWIPLSNYAPLASDAGTDTDHSLLTSSATLTGNRSTETLKIAPDSPDQTLSLASHTLTTGGLLVPDGNANPFNVTGGILRGAHAADLIIHQHGSADLTVSSTIADHGGPTALTKTGPGTLVLGGANAYTGDTFLNQGTLRLASPAALPTTTSLRFHGGILDLAGHSIIIESLTGIGSLQNSGSTTATITTGATTAFTLAPGQSLDTHVVQNTAAPNSYQLWAASHGLTAGVNAAATDDADHDGITNLVEYALGMNPKVSDLPPGTFDGSTLTFTKGADALANGDVAYAIEESDDLGITDPWEEVAATEMDNTISHTFPPGRSRVFARLKAALTTL
jgi:autotransporter-associated beta strand protein